MKNMRAFYIACFVLLVSMVLTYSNHFNNSFHFDDAHVIVNNPHLRSLSNVPSFFADARTFSVLPTNQTYRPVFTLSLALDYYLGQGYVPFYFHLSSFLWYLIQLVLMFFLFMSIYDRCYKHDWNKWLALFGVGWYGLHTANAETINYISARSDLLSTLFVVMALALYIYSPVSKKYWLYLIPFILGVLVKPAALMFAPLLFLYVYLIQERSLAHSLICSLPAIILSLFLYWLQNIMVPSTFYPTDISMLNYLITQPYVSLYYFKTFLLPIGLSADYDWQAFADIYNLKFLAGLVFVAAMVGLAGYCSRKKQHRPIALGILWFFIALLPSSSIIPLAEVLNDHRIFFPYVGLMLAVCWILGQLLFKYEQVIKKNIYLKILIVLIGIFILSANALGVRYRNNIWKTEESLWYDVTVKSPKNGRGLMNYGLTQMEKGRYDIALKYFDEALKYNPRYGFLFVNLGILHSAMNDPKLAEYNFKKALEVAPDYYGSYFYYARWLYSQGKNQEALRLVRKAAQLSPSFLPAQQLLKQLCPKTSPENFLNLSLAYYEQGRYMDSILSAQEALKLRPNYAQAYNNIGAAYNAMKKWDEAIKALNMAIKIKPDFQLAKNNLDWARKQKGN